MLTVRTCLRNIIKNDFRLHMLHSGTRRIINCGKCHDAFRHCHDTFVGLRAHRGRVDVEKVLLVAFCMEHYLISELMLSELVVGRVCDGIERVGLQAVIFVAGMWG